MFLHFFSIKTTIFLPCGKCHAGNSLLVFLPAPLPFAHLHPTAEIKSGTAGRTHDWASAYKQILSVSMTNAYKELQGKLSFNIHME